MEDSPRAARLIRFEAYRVDLQSGELYKNGQKVKLSGQPFEVLAMLLARPGQLVTREELQKKLWPQDTFVDFDHGLNTAINKIREALGDSAENPHFVETLPRRGYRFIADVGAGLVPALEGRPRGAPLRKRWAAIAAVVVVVAVALGIASWLWFGRSGATTPEAPLAAVPLTSYPGIEESPSFSPDGTQVAFSWDGDKQDNFDIYVKLIGAEPPLRLTTHPAKENSPAWSPDGRWIAFCRDLPGGKYAVVLTAPMPGPEQILTETFRELSSFDVKAPFLTWSPDSRWLVFVGQETLGERYTASLYLLSLETAEKRKLTSPPTEGYMGDSSAAFSPDGRTLAFFRWTGYHNSDLYLLDLSPDLKPVAEPKRLTAGNWLAFSPTWTRDGRRLIFSATPSRVLSLWSVAASGSSQPQKLSSVAENASYPTISRRADRLTYAHQQYDVNIYRVAIPSRQRKATPPTKFISSTRMDSCALFSPDGKKIAFESDRSGSSEVWICDSDGSNPIQITSFGGPETVGCASWSPDSSRLTLAVSTEGRPQLYVINAIPGRPRRLTSDPGGASNPYWSRDGRWIYFDSISRGIWKIPPEAGVPVPVAGSTGWSPIESPDGKFVYSIDSAADVWCIKRTPTQGGEAKQILTVAAPIFSVVEDGIYFVPVSDPNSVQFLNTATGSIQRIASIEGPAYSALDVSPDRRWILYTRRDQTGSDLMLVENFH